MSAFNSGYRPAELIASQAVLELREDTISLPRSRQTAPTWLAPKPSRSRCFPENRPSNVAVDIVASEIFVADGYGNHRVIVFDSKTSAYKHHWGANGRPPGDASVKGFDNPVHSARLSRDGLLYVCDRINNRIQVFHKDGTFVKEFIVAPDTRGNGST